MILNYLNVDEQKTAGKRHGLVKRTAKLNQLTYFRAILTLKTEAKNVFVKWKSKMLWGRSFAFISTENKRMWIQSRLIWIGLIGEDLLNLGRWYISTKITTDLPMIWQLSQFSQGPLNILHPQTTGSSLEKTTHTFPINGVGGYWLLGGLWMLSLRGI